MRFAEIGALEMGLGSPMLGIIYCAQASWTISADMMLTNINVMLNETIRQLKKLGAGSHLTTEPELTIKTAVSF